MADNEIVVKISADNKEYKAKLTETGDATTGLGDKLKGMAGIATAAFATLVAGIGASLAAYAESEAATRKLSTALQNQGVFSKQTMDAYKKYAAEVQHVTGLDDDAVVAAQAKIQTYLGDKKVTQELTFAMADLAEAKGVDLETTAELIGKGINGQAGALKKLGIEIDDHMTKEEKLASILSQVNQKFGDMAKSANTGLGSIRGLKSAFGDLLEEIGAKFAPTATTTIGALTKITEGVTKNFDNIISALFPKFALLNNLFSQSNKKTEDSLGVQDQIKAKFAKQAQDREEARQRRELAALDAENEVKALKAQGASQALIDIKTKEAESLKTLADENFKGNRASIMARVAEIQGIYQTQMASDLESNKAFNEELLAQNQEFQALDSEQKRLFLEQNKQQLQEKVLSEKEAANEIAKETLKQDVDRYNQFLINKQKYGEAAAKIQNLLHTQELQDMNTAFSDLAQMQKSKFGALKAIGKAAAVAQISIQTAQSAMNIFTAFSAIPFVGVGLGIAGAAAAVLYGAERIGEVTAAAQGGLITGGVPGRDSVPGLLMPGELVVPTKNFEEVVNAVSSRRESVSASGNGGGGVAHLVLELRNDLMDFIEAKLVERQNLSISIQGA